jgi:hypothetical protein
MGLREVILLAGTGREAAAPQEVAWQQEEPPESRKQRPGGWASPCLYPHSCQDHGSRGLGARPR